MRFRIISVTFLCSFICSIVLSACKTIPAVSLFTESQLNYPQAEILFEVTLPSPIDENVKILVELLDDVTGLAYNPTRLEMSKQDEFTYFVKTTAAIGSTLKYRYLKESENSTVEYTSQRKPVRFRLTQVDGPKVIKDIVAAWVDNPYTGPVGRIRGQLLDAENNSPIPNLLVSAEGIQTITSSDGSFILEGLTPGTHDLTIMSLDGAYEVFEQGAVIADEATTPVFVNLSKRKTVNVKFEVKLPEGIDPALPLRLATNLYSLGNSYSDPYAGTTNTAANLPVLKQNVLGRYEMELTLPVGTDLRYKFTLGDGFWNGELSTQGGFVERQLIVPTKNTTVQNIVETFTAPGTSSIVFNTSVPSTTPAEDSVDLQLNPFDWMGPLPMARVDQTNWTFTLYNPQYFFSTIQYRYCRSNTCSSGVETTSDGKTRNLTISASDLTINDKVEKWALLEASTVPTTVMTESSSNSPRNDFLAGFELSDDLSLNDMPFMENTFKIMSDWGSKWVILDPTWTASLVNPPLLEPVIGKDLLWNNWLEISAQARQKNLNIGIYPRINFNGSSDVFWTNAGKDPGWWQSWFDRYHRFIIHNADLANTIGASAIFIGSPDMAPAMTNGILRNGSLSNAPESADDQWRQLIKDIRSRFSGAVVGVIAFPSATGEVPGWLDSVDAVYVQLSPVMDTETTLDSSALIGYFDNLLDKELHPLQSELSKPFILGLSVVSSSNANEGCTDQNGSCDEATGINAPSAEINQDLQAKIYNASIMTISSRDWIKGFVSRNYQPAINLLDTSSSVRGKPAADVLWYWYRYIANISQ